MYRFRLIEEADRIFDCGWAQVHVALRRGEILMRSASVRRFVTGTYLRVPPFGIVT